MKNTLTKEELGNDLLYDTLVALDGVFGAAGVELYVVGALARDLAMKLLGAEMSPRKTLDLDVAVALRDWNQFDAISRRLQDCHFKKLGPKQRFAYKGPDGTNDYEVDVVPFGDIADDETVRWPPEQQPEMSVRCYDDIMPHAVQITVAGLTLKMAPLAAQFLIKMDTWIDRNDRENKDAIDMMFIMRNFYMAMVMGPDCCDIPQEVSVEGFDDYMLLPGAQWIAVEVAPMLSAEHLGYYVDFLDGQLNLGEKSRLLQHMTTGHEEEPQMWTAVAEALRAMRDILNAELGRRCRP